MLGNEMHEDTIGSAYGRMWDVRNSYKNLVEIFL
jgi:hypothetical protein